MVFSLFQCFFFSLNSLEKVFVWKKSSGDELYAAEYRIFQWIARETERRKKELRNCSTSALDLQMISFYLWLFLPIQVSNSRSINDYRGKSSRFKANTTIIMPIQILLHLNTYKRFYCIWNRSSIVVRRKKTIHIRTRNKALCMRKKRNKKLIDFYAWIKTKLSTHNA